MAYLTVEDFKGGMDRRRERVAGTPGTLWLGKNIHINRGGDIERRKKFVPEFHVANTFGAATLRGQLYVFGSADLASSMPIGVRYQRLTPAFVSSMTAVLDVKAFAGALYVIAEYANGHVHHFYDGVLLGDWDVIAEVGASYEALASLMAAKINANEAVTAEAFGDTITIQAVTPGTAFTISQSAVDGASTNDQTITLTEVQANVAGVTEVLAGATFTINSGTEDAGVNTVTSILVNNVEILTGTLNWRTSNSATAAALAASINNGNVTHGYSATVLNNVVTLSAAPGTGATPNGYAVEMHPHGNFDLTGSATLTGGVTAVTAVAQVSTAAFGGTFQTGDTFTITVNGTAYVATGRASGTGRSLYVDKKRVWSPVGSLWRYCKLSDATVWNPASLGSDAGFINIAAESEGNEDIAVAVRYQNQAAIYAPTGVTLFQLDEDPANFAFQGYLDNTGTIAAKSVVRYGNNDVFYLAISGIRSLRARDASNAPFVSDIGNAIDPFVLEWLDEVLKVDVVNAIGVIEPRDGRHWLVVGSRIFVLSYFPGGKISAWSFYDAEEFGTDSVQALAKTGSRLFVRAGDYVYVYGGLDGTTYPDADEVIAEVQLPFLSGNTPGTVKDISGFDMAGTNTWEAELVFDANDTDKSINAGRFDKISYTDNNDTMAKLPGRVSMVAANLTCRKAGAATLSMLTIHYEAEGEKAG